MEIIMAISNVIFDLGAVLLEWKPSKIVTEFTNNRELQNKIKEHILSHSDWLELDKGALVESDAYTKFAERCNVNPGTIKQFFNHAK